MHYNLQGYFKGWAKNCTTCKCSRICKVKGKGKKKNNKNVIVKYEY